MLNLSAIFNRPPRKVVQWFTNKGLKITGPWQSWWKQAHTQSFTVARVTALDVLQAIQTQVQRAVQEGITESEFQRTLKERLIKTGWWTDVKTGEIVPGRDDPEAGARLNANRLRTIYKINVATAYQSGKFESMQAAAKFFPYWQYNTLDDQFVRAAHAALDGMVFAHDDPIWDVIFPPNGFNCRCTVRALSAKQVEQKGLSVADGSRMMVSGTYTKRDGSKIAIRGFRVNGKEYFIDPGWDYNPAKGQAAALNDLADERIAQAGADAGDKPGIIARLRRFFGGQG